MSRMSDLIEEHEGRVEKIYIDHLGNPTVGVGHKIVKGDEEYGQPAGTKVRPKRVDKLFKKDFAIAVKDAASIHRGLRHMPEPAQIVLVNMAFNMGRPRLSKFKKMHAAMKDERWADAVVELRDSRLARQVPNRVNDLATILEEIIYT